MLLAGLGMMWSLIVNICTVFNFQPTWLIKLYYLNYGLLLFAWGPACVVQTIPARKLFPKKFFLPSRSEFYKGINHFCLKWMVRFEISFLFYCIVLFSLSYFSIGAYGDFKFPASLMFTYLYGIALKIMTAAYNAAHLPDMDNKTFEETNASSEKEKSLFYMIALKIMSAAYNAAHLPDMDKKIFEEKNVSSEKKKSIPEERYDGGKQRQYDFSDDDLDVVEVDITVFTQKKGNHQESSNQS